MGTIFNMVNDFEKTFTKVDRDVSSNNVTKYSSKAKILASTEYNNYYNDELRRLKIKIIQLEDKLNNADTEDKWRIESALELCINNMEEMKRDAELCCKEA